LKVALYFRITWLIHRNHTRHLILRKTEILSRVPYLLSYFHANRPLFRTLLYSFFWILYLL
jgi:hypothetical protein